MSHTRRRMVELVLNYSQSLEQRIERGDSSLVCEDEALWRQVEEILADGNAQDTHSLGLDPLKEMEESLKAAMLPPKGTAGHIQWSRGGLRGLEKAFEVLEQASLNLYLGPWRKEYKAVKMYSGMFTHYIKPVLSTPQIKELFGLLGYQPSTRQKEQLNLQSVWCHSADELLKLACAFFLARCECRLLLTALENCTNLAEWELSMVQERQRGHSIKVAFDNTMKKLEQSPLELSRTEQDLDLDLDLYTAEEANNGLKEISVDTGGSLRSQSWVGQTSTSPPATTPHSNGVSAPPKSPLPQERLCVSTLIYQPTRTSPGGLTSSRNASITIRQSRSPREDSTKSGHDDDNVNTESSKPRSPAPQASGAQRRVPSSSDEPFNCNCVKSSSRYLEHCITCNVTHRMTCALLVACKGYEHMTREVDRMAASPQRLLSEGSVNVLPPEMKSNVACVFTHSASELANQSTQPIPYHDCCDPANPEPQFLCRSCWVFHGAACRGVEYCKSMHNINPLGVCSCGKKCPRQPLVLCRYCGSEYCNNCWFRSPVVCRCGQTFDQSSSV